MASITGWAPCEPVWVHRVDGACETLVVPPLALCNPSASCTLSQPPDTPWEDRSWDFVSKLCRPIVTRVLEVPAISTACRDYSYCNIPCNTGRINSRRDRSSTCYTTIQILCNAWTHRPVIPISPIIRNNHDIGFCHPCRFGHCCHKLSLLLLLYDCRHHITAVVAGVLIVLLKAVQ